MNRAEHNCDRDNRQNFKPEIIALHAKFEIRTVAIKVKSFLSLATESNRDPRISSWRFARTNHGRKVQPLHFAGMDRARVVATGGLRTPDGEATPILHGQHRAISSIDRINLVPADLNDGERIMNSNSLVKDLQVWAVDNQIQASAERSNNQNKCVRVGEAVSDNAFNRNSDKKNRANNCGSDTFSGPIGHFVLQSVVQSLHKGACNV